MTKQNEYDYEPNKEEEKPPTEEGTTEHKFGSGGGSEPKTETEKHEKYGDLPQVTPEAADGVAVDENALHHFEPQAGWDALRQFAIKHRETMTASSGKTVGTLILEFMDKVEKGVPDA